MSLSLTVTLDHNFPAGRPVTLPALRKHVSISLAGSVGNGDLAAGAVTAAKVTPGAYWYADSSSYASNTYSLTLSPALTAYANGVCVAFRATSDNGDTQAMANVNSLGAKKIYNHYDQAVKAGDIRNGQIVVLRYLSSLDSGSGGWQMISNRGNAPDRHASTAGTEPAYTLTLAPTVKSYGSIDGVPIRAKIHSANSGAATLNVDGLGAKSVKKRNNQALAAGDLQPDTVHAFVYDTALDVFLLTSPVHRFSEEFAVNTEQASLVVKVNAANPAYQVDIDADDLVLRNSDGKHYRAQSVNLTADITGSGANGLDTGSESADTWYYIWAIYNPSTGTMASLLSESSSAPSMPSGYTFKTLVGAVRNDNSSNFRKFHQIGREIWAIKNEVFSAKTGVGTSWTAISATTADHDALKEVVPPIAKFARVIAGNTSNNNRGIAVASDGNGDIGLAVASPVSSAQVLVTYATAQNYRIPLVTTQDFYWQSNDSSANYKMEAIGWEF